MAESPKSVPVRSAAPPPRPVKRVPLRARRKRKRLIVAGACVILCASAAYAAHYVSYLPQYNISSVHVSGVRVLAPAAIQSFVETQIHSMPAGFLSPTNVLTFQKEPLETAITKFFPRVRNVTIKRDSPLSTVLDVQVEERDAFAQWCATDSSCYLMDDSGYIFDSAAASTTLEETYVFRNGIDASSTPIGQTYADGHFPGMAALLNLFAQAGFMPLGATIENDRDFTVQLQPGYYVHASFGLDASDVVRNLKLVLSSDALASEEDQLEYVDLRFGDRVYYKLKGAAQATPAGNATSTVPSALQATSTRR